MSPGIDPDADKAKYDNALKILLEMGEFFQIQDDYLDCCKDLDTPCVVAMVGAGGWWRVVVVAMVGGCWVLVVGGGGVGTTNVRISTRRSPGTRIPTRLR